MQRVSGPREECSQAVLSWALNYACPVACGTAKRPLWWREENALMLLIDPPLYYS